MMKVSTPKVTAMDMMRFIKTVISVVILLKRWVYGRVRVY